MKCVGGAVRRRRCRRPSDGTSAPAKRKTEQHRCRPALGGEYPPDPKPRQRAALQRSPAPARNQAAAMAVVAAVVAANANANLPSRESCCPTQRTFPVRSVNRGVVGWVGWVGGGLEVRSREAAAGCARARRGRSARVRRGAMRCDAVRRDAVRRGATRCDAVRPAICHPAAARPLFHAGLNLTDLVWNLDARFGTFRSHPCRRLAQRRRRRRHLIRSATSSAAADCPRKRPLNPIFPPIF